MALSKSQTLSKALASKIAQQKALAPDLLPKTRLCAGVVLALAAGEPEAGSLALLKAGMGANWSPVAAFQFMSGKQALFSAACGTPQEQASLLLAQQIAEAVFQEAGKAPLSPSGLQALAMRHARPAGAAL
jgi:hypothetical protein